ncbi:MAG: holo-[acyl-carrier-protein] synthase [Chloroflexi bacterium HGW-Chloroflexi-6]|nr:MAG: holo-[acyl-carrier-protein] synthase [Chloroflexi bacterium HGW-Chloroflexi-6]
MKISTGIDLVEIERIESTIARHGERFLSRVFTPAERQSCAGRTESLAARFAAKEAVAKALGSGLDGFGFQDIEITRAENGAPGLILHGVAAQKASLEGLVKWSISMSHSQGHATAIAVGYSE